MSYPHPLDQLIAETREKLSKAKGEVARAEREVRDAQIKIEALEEAKALTAKQPINASERQQSHAGNGTRRPRSLSDSWQQVLRKMNQHGEADYDAILGYCGEAGFRIERESLRAQMFNYVTRGLLVRPRDGVFRLTSEGREAAGIPARGGGASANPTEAP
jgi:hypothetical protein